MKSLELAPKIKEFKGLMKLAHKALESDPKARVSKQVLIHTMWMHDEKTSNELTFRAFAVDILEDKFKVESYTRAARKVVEIHPHLGNPNRTKLAEDIRSVIRASDTNPDQIEIDFKELIKEL